MIWFSLVSGCIKDQGPIFYKIKANWYATLYLLNIINTSMKSTYFFFLRVLTPIVSCNKTKHLTSSLLIKVLSSMYMKKQRWLPPTSIDAARESSAAFEGLSNNAHYGWILNCLVGLWKGTIYGLRLNMAENENTFVILQSLLTCAVCS